MNKPMTSFNTPIPSSEEDWKSKNYLLRVSLIRCQCCGETHTESSFWRAMVNTKHPTVIREVPIIDLAQIKLKLPLIKLQSEKTQPVCHLCLDIATELGYIEAHQEVSERDWKAAIVASERAAKAAARVAKPEPKSVDLGEFL